MGTLSPRSARGKRRLKLWFRALIQEHNLVNLLWLNLHSVDGKLYRSAQPTPWQLRRIVRRYGIKTVVNLRGRSKNPVYLLEKAVCRTLGVKMIDLKIASRAPADAARLEKLRETFETIEYPALMHCKAGADRSTLAAVLYRHWRLEEPLKEALEKEARFWPYGYIRHSGAGIIRYYFERFLHSGEKEIVAWTERLDAKALKRAFNAERRRGWIDWIYEKVLRRE